MKGNFIELNTIYVFLNTFQNLSLNYTSVQVSVEEFGFPTTEQNTEIEYVHLKTIHDGGLKLYLHN